MAWLRKFCSAIDTRWVAVLCLILSLAVGVAVAQTNSWRLHGYEAWQGMTQRERYSYITGCIVGSYSFGLKYMLDNPELKGLIPNPYDYMLGEYSSAELYNLVELVYARPEYRNVTLPEIVCWPEVWWKELRIGI
jgi:hypothetical protein